MFGTVIGIQVFQHGTESEAQAHFRAALELVMLGGTHFDAPAGRWTDVTYPVEGYRPGERLHVRLDTPGGVDVHAVRAE